MKERRKRYGRGHWERKQLYAIIASYRQEGHEPEWIATRLGVGRGIVHQAFDYFLWVENRSYDELHPGLRG